MKSKRKGPSAAMDTALAIIGAEHHAFDAALAEIIDRIQLVRGHRVEPDTAPFEKRISLLATFMDHFHHPKEDDFLFKAVQARSGEAADLIEFLQHDHAQSPAIFAELLKALDGTRRGASSQFEDFAQLMERFAVSQLHHMHRENDELIPIAKRVLRVTDWTEIAAAFEANRDPLFSAMGAVVGGAPGRVPERR